MVEIVEVSTPADLAAVRTLFGEYKQTVGVDLWFGSGFQREIDALPAPYEPPGGRLVLAREGAEIAGCGAARSVGPGTVELRRLWIRKPFRKHGVGRQIMEALMDWARRNGHRAARLEVLSVMPQAETLFRSMGFAPIPDDRKDPFPGSVLMGRQL